MFEDKFMPHILFEEADDSGGSADEGGEGDEGADSGNQTGKDIDNLDDAISALAKARQDAAKQRTKRKEIEEQLQELNGIKDKFDKFKSVLGDDDDDLDPEKLKNKTETLEQQLQQEQVKNKITIQAIQDDLDPDLTIAYLQNKGTLSELDASDSEALQNAISKAAKEKPNLKTGKAVTTGDSNNESGNGKADLNSWIRQQAAR